MEFFVNKYRQLERSGWGKWTYEIGDLENLALIGFKFFARNLHVLTDR